MESMVNGRAGIPVFSHNTIKTPNNFYILDVSKILTFSFLLPTLNLAFNISSLDLAVLFVLR